MQSVLILGVLLLSVLMPQLKTSCGLNKSLAEPLTASAVQKTAVSELKKYSRAWVILNVRLYWFISVNNPPFLIWIKTVPKFPSGDEFESEIAASKAKVWRAVKCREAW